VAAFAGESRETPDAALTRLPCCPPHPAPAAPQNVKFVELLSLPFSRSSEEHVRQQITYRYAALKRRLGRAQSRLQEVVQLVKLKNPSLLLALTQGGGAAAAATGSGGGRLPGGGSSAQPPAAATAHTPVPPPYGAAPGTSMGAGMRSRY
jgi:hypothetical protein